MKVPFQSLQVCGDVLFAARGGNIHSFGLVDGSHISCWKYPVEKKDSKAAAAVATKSEDKSEPLVISTSEQATSAATQQPEEPEEPEEDGPPAKRVKLESDAHDGEKKKEAKAEISGTENGKTAPEGQTNGNENGKTPAKDQANGKKNGEGRAKHPKSEKKHFHPARGPMSQHSERPIVKLLTSTGNYLVALTDPDKSIWVLEHDGRGHLKQLSRRMMPKRPCSITITPNGENILSADKFGDVYSLPLIQPETDGLEQSTETATAAAVPDAPVAPEVPSPTASPSPAPEQHNPEYKPQASELTVHTKRNLLALAHQKRQQQRKTDNVKPLTQDFTRTLLLGHVSLLTAITLAHDAAGRPYIITADRDEHIRVSRGIPSMAHVIESYCLGHEEFVNKLCIPSTSPASSSSEIRAAPLFPQFLVSGGGDNDLFVWNWLEGRLLSRTPLLPKVQDACGPDVGKIAVSGIHCWGRTRALDNECTLLVICERVPAIFMFALDAQGVLQYRRTIEMEGNPLDIAVLKSTHAGARVAVAVDPSSSQEPGSSSLLSIEYANGAYEVSDGFVSYKGLDDEDSDITVDELKKMLYTAEAQRKTDSHEDEDRED